MLETPGKFNGIEYASIEQTKAAIRLWFIQLAHEGRNFQLAFYLFIIIIL